jgi:hypothetical protein
VQKTLLALTPLFVAQSLFASDFQPSPEQTHSGYIVYETYQEVTPKQAEAAGSPSPATVQFANRFWRGSKRQALESRIAKQTVAGATCGTWRALLKNNGKWIEIGTAVVEGVDHSDRQVFLLYEWNDEGGGTRKSTFVIDQGGYDPALRMFGKVLEIGNGLALVPIAVYYHPWIKLVILDLNTFRPKGLIDYSEMEILRFTEGKTLQVRFKKMATKMELREDPDYLEKLPWQRLDIMTNGVLNPAFVDESAFKISIPAEK